MDIPRQRLNILHSPRPRHITASFALLMTGAAAAGLLSAAGEYRNAGVIIVMSLGAAFLLAAPVTIQAVLLTWFATAPIASFYLRYPLDRSIITYNRAVFCLLIVMLLFEARPAVVRSIETSGASRFGRINFSLSKFEVAWALLSLLALASAFSKSNNFELAARIAIDTFWLPLVAFYFGRRHFDLRSGARLFLFGCMALALFLFVTGAFELATGIDLFPQKGGELVRDGERRVNGPFVADVSFAIICLVLSLFLQTAPRLLRVRFDRGGNLVYRCATAAAALGAFLSLFRVAAFALVVCWIAQRWSVNHDRLKLTGAELRRLLSSASLIAMILLVVGGLLAAMVPSISGNRLVDPRSAFGRLATWQAAAEIVLEKPVFGIGLTNYSEYFDASHYYSDEAPEEILDTKAATSPHSNLLWIASELGLFGLALYIAANLYLFLMGWNGFKRASNRRRRIAASCFVALIVAYWIAGVALTSGYYSDLNICLLFLLGALSNQFSGVAAPPGQPRAAVESKY